MAEIDVQKLSGESQPSADESESASNASHSKYKSRTFVTLLVAILVVLPALSYLGSRIWSLSVGSAPGVAAREQRPKGGRRKTSPAFSLDSASIPVKEILRGAAKDGIPSFTHPRYVIAKEATFLAPDEPVIGIEFDGDARAYPLRILDLHEAVNDTVGGIPVAVTYCPLCDSSIVFDRRVGDETIEFGISGLLYNSNVLLYDRQRDKPERLWSQLMTESITGTSPGRKLQTLPLEVTTWNDWRARHPDSQVLWTSHPPGPRAYQSYFARRGLMFPVKLTDDRLPAKIPVLGVWTTGVARAYPLSAFQQEENERELQEELGEHKFTLAYNPQAKSLRVVKSAAEVKWMYAYWFAWYAFNPETELFEFPGEKE